mmetsp:Transcript_3242/g.8669  ORF Transcript_3242/g.8669 Transcript_3242/m.8669 type:complete len:182 (-) Transcript_3242:275-820(-)
MQTNCMLTTPSVQGMERYLMLSKLRARNFPQSWLDGIKHDFPTLHHLLYRMMSDEPSERPSASAVAGTIESILEQFTISSLDRHGDDAILLRVEAMPRDDVLQNTMQLLKDAVVPDYAIDILQYGMKGGTNKAVLEFAIGVHGIRNKQTVAVVGHRIVSSVASHSEVHLIRRIFMANTAKA